MSRLEAGLRRLPLSKFVVTLLLLLLLGVSCDLQSRALLAGAAEGEPECVSATVARKALAGTWGKLADWQRQGYERLLQNGTHRRIAWITHYSHTEPGVGYTTASGQRVQAGRTAAMLEPRRQFGGLPYGSYVLVTTPTGLTLRQVWDTGSPANMRRARSRGAETWVDIYMSTSSRRALNTTYILPVYVEVQ